MRPWRLWALVLLLLLGMDFLDPSPGIFFWDHERLFVAGVAEVKPALPPLTLHRAPTDLGGSAAQIEHLTASGRLEPLQGLVLRPRPGRWDTGRTVASSPPSPAAQDDH